MLRRDLKIPALDFSDTDVDKVWSPRRRPACCARNGIVASGITLSRMYDIGQTLKSRQVFKVIDADHSGEVSVRPTTIVSSPVA